MRSSCDRYYGSRSSKSIQPPTEIERLKTETLSLREYCDNLEERIEMLERLVYTRIFIPDETVGSIS